MTREPGDRPGQVIHPACGARAWGGLFAAVTELELSADGGAALATRLISIFSKNLLEGVPPGFHRRASRAALLATAAATVILPMGGSLSAADLPIAYKAPPTPKAYDWSGFYVGGHLGLAAGNSDWTANPTVAGLPPVSGSLNVFQAPDHFFESGSFFAGAQAGYNRMLSNRILIGTEADISFHPFPDVNGLSITGVSNFNSPVLGPASLSETAVTFGTVRGRIGYAPGSWLFYATGGLAWTYNQQTLTQTASGNSEAPFLWRFGWAAGAGVEFPVAPNWTAKAEYLYTGYPTSSVNYPFSGQRISSDFSLQQLRLGLNYNFGPPQASFVVAPFAPDIVNVHGQATFVDQGYPSFRSPYEGPNSLSGGGQNRETFDLTLAVGLKLWQGAEFWTNPEIDQGFGLSNTHGTAGSFSGEAYKLGQADPYARIQRAFLRQTINLGGDTEKVDADMNQFAGSRSSDRLVLTVGRFGVADLFDTNKYASNPKTDFLNWSLINTGTFDYAGDGWGYTYGAAAEWYWGRWTLRAGVFDLSTTPAGGVSPTAYGLDSTFQQFQMVGEIEERHELWGQPGKIKITGLLSRGNAGQYSDAVALSLTTGLPADITAVRSYVSRPSVSMNIEQQINDNLGFFLRAGWADGNIEPWDFTDIDRTIAAGLSINGKSWGRPDDTIGVAGIVNGISAAHVAFLNAGGLGILIGDGQLNNYGLEKIFEAYYSYSLNASSKVTFDYQFVSNPGYNADRGPVNAFAARYHWQF
jgi:high affinity Mn2+ porin